MARASFKGFLKLGAVTCPVALYAAASTYSRIVFHTINRTTGHRVRRLFVDSETGAAVERDDQVKGYERGDGDYVILEPDEVAGAGPDSDKTMSVEAFVRCGDIDDVYFERPYFIAPADNGGEEAFHLLRAAMEKAKVAAIVRAVLFRRERTLLVRPAGAGLVGTTLAFDYEVRSAKEAFADVPDLRIKGEMLDLAEHIIRTKAGTFDPSKFDDRYEAAVADLVKAKLSGTSIKPRKTKAPARTVDLMSALRDSAKLSGATGAASRTAPAKPAGARREAAKTQPKAASRREAG